MIDPEILFVLGVVVLGVVLLAIVVREILKIK